MSKIGSDAAFTSADCIVCEPFSAETAVETTYRHIVETINEFESKIREDEISAIVLPCFSIAIMDVGFWNPNLVFFYGKKSDGAQVQIVQHVSQISFCLAAVKRPDPEKQRRKIGFDLK